MSSWQGGGGYTSRGGLSARQGGGASEQVQIHVGNGFDFDSEIEGLTAHVGKIKEMSKLIDEERKQQGQIINSLEDSMERAKLALRKATQRLNIAYRQAKSNHLLYLVLFIIVLLVTLYILSKLYRVGQLVVGH